MNYFDRFTEYLLDEDRRLSSKAGVVVFVLLGILFVDNYLGFSYHYANEKKIEQIQRVNAIIKDPSIDSTTKTFAINMRSRIIEHKNLVDYVLSFFRGRSNIVIKHQTNKAPDDAKKNEPIKASIKNNFWFNASASGFYFAFAVIMIPLMLVADKKASILTRLSTGLLTAVSFVLFGLFLVWVLGLIPQISNSTWLWNYLVNVLVQVSIIGLLYLADQRRR